ncbi:MAG TPA: prepilin-type N-terminal cleavage/methylation domain-containing protein [Burkholderiales bacterium]|jgi:general secretion pathway protein G|nr:prepilin-type N-terminal cleavage/methylation domain-containing protein [Burkholderiales bacterium]
MTQGRGTADEGRGRSNGPGIFARVFPLEPRPSGGFTLIEILVVMAIIALLLTIAVPRYLHSTDRAKEAVLKQDLVQMRDAIDKYHGDRGRYPDVLEDLVTGKYLRRIPPDPITDSVETWVTVPPEDSGKGAVYDVKSGAAGTALDGTPYGAW